MSIWLENSEKKLLPLSTEKENFAIAIKEWFYTDELIEYDEPEETCELCKKDGFRCNCFKIDLRADESKKLLINLKMAQYNRIKKALSVSQRKYYKENSKNFDSQKEDMQ